MIILVFILFFVYEIYINWNKTLMKWLSIRFNHKMRVMLTLWPKAVIMLLLLRSLIKMFIHLSHAYKEIPRAYIVTTTNYVNHLLLHRK